MKKIEGWLVLLIGVLLVLAAPGLALISLTDIWVAWLLALAVIVIGVLKVIKIK